jgi:ribonuclease HI
VTPNEPDVEYFRDLEERLWRNEPGWRDGILAEDFTEFCRFGAVYGRDHLLQPAAAEVDVDFPFENFTVEALTDEVVLITYENTVHANGRTERARRSSVWVENRGEWKLRFMQATTLDS